MSSKSSNCVWLLGDVKRDPVLRHLMARCRTLRVPHLALDQFMLPGLSVDQEGLLHTGYEACHPKVVFNRLAVDQLRLRATHRSFGIGQWESFWAGMGKALPRLTFNRPLVNAPLGLPIDPTYLRGRLKAAGYAVLSETIIYSSAQFKSCLVQSEWLYVRDAVGATITFRNGNPMAAIEILRFPMTVLLTANPLRVALVLDGSFISAEAHWSLTTSEMRTLCEVSTELHLSWGAIIFSRGLQTQIANALPFCPDEFVDRFVGTLCHQFDDILLS